MRAFALLAGALFLLHHFRYATARLSPEEAAASEHAHSYLTFAAVLVVLLIGIAVVFFAQDLMRAHRRLLAAEPPRPRLGRLWLNASLALLGSYFVQETAEALIAHRGGGFDVVFAPGWWLAVLLAVTLGVVVALLQRGAQAAIVRLARRYAYVGVPVAPLRWSPRRHTLRRRPLLLGSVAGRAPPALAFRP